MNERLQHQCTRRSLVVAMTTAAMGCLLGLPMAAAAAFADEDDPHAMSQPSDCARCHTCEEPTYQKPCLPACTRVQAAAEELAQKLGPDVVILDELQDAYLPVPFDHKGHAGMAEMTHGCAVCHHYTPEGQDHPSCKTCHAVAVKGTGIHKPGLKGAYHRQCLNCHKDWTDASDCAICHRRRTIGPRTRDEAQLPTTDSILGRMHPPITAPKTEIYRAEFKKGAESVVMFRHWEHVNSFDLKCVDCHHEESCTRCHRKENEQKPPRSITEHHKPCLRCHERHMDESIKEITGTCRRCHWQEGQEKPKPFDHADTGWLLSRYHDGIGCRDCHKTVPYTRLDNNCDACHSAWDPESFDHRVTGQWLDANHREIDCADCHINREFDVTPKCSECHDEDEGYVFPEKRPGALMPPHLTPHPRGSGNQR